MKTNIKVDSELLTKTMTISGFNSQTETIENALKLLISISMQKGMKALKGKLPWVGNLEQMRLDK